MLTFSLNDLLDYTDWERQKWRDWFVQQSNDALTISAGPHGDGRFSTVADLIRHIFSAEKRYIDRLTGRELTDPASIRADNVEALFAFGSQSRRDLKEFVSTYPVQQWDVPQEFRLMNSLLRATPRKIIMHTVLHEIRHWAQIATLLRINGFRGEFHDLLFSPVFGGEFRREQGTS